MKQSKKTHSNLQAFVSIYRIIQKRNKRIKKLQITNAPKIILNHERIERKDAIFLLKEHFKTLLQEMKK